MFFSQLCYFQEKWDLIAQCTLTQPLHLMSKILLTKKKTHKQFKLISCFVFENRHFLKLLFVRYFFFWLFIWVQRLCKHIKMKRNCIRFCNLPILLFSLILQQMDAGRGAHQVSIKHFFYLSLFLVIFFKGIRLLYLARLSFEISHTIQKDSSRKSVSGSF